MRSATAVSVQQAAHAPYEETDARILSLQPPFLDTPPKTSNDWAEIYQHCESSLNSKRSWRYSWWQHWAILAQYLLPYRYQWVVAANTYNRGFPVNDSIVNETGTLAARICASGLLAGLMSAANPWMKMDVAIENYPVDAEGQDWLDDTSERILAVLGSSNWYTVGAQMFSDIAVFGQAPVLIYEDSEDVIRCYLPCAGEYFLTSGARLATDGVAREFTFTVQQIVDFWKVENCPEEVRNLWTQGGGALDREFVVAHIIEPNFALASRSGSKREVAVVPGSFPYREIYWLRGRQSTGELSRRGFHEKPFMCPGWSKTSNDPYFRSPGMDALGGIRQLQHEERRKGEYIDKFVRPPVAADVSLENKPSSILPGEITYVNATEGKHQIYPIFEVNPGGFQPLTEDIKRVEERINRAFFTDIFLMITQMEGVQPRNQLEILERKGEKIQQLGPVIQLFQQEASIGIQRVLAIMARHRGGLIRPPPRSLHHVPIGITFTGTLAMLQRAAETASMERMFATAGSLGEAALAAGMPSPIRSLNLDECMRVYGKRIGFPAKLFYTEQQLAEQDQARQQQAQEQQAMQAALPAVQAAQSLSKTPVGGGQTALSAMLGGGPTQAPGGAQ